MNSENSQYRHESNSNHNSQEYLSTLNPTDIRDGIDTGHVTTPEALPILMHKWIGDIRSNNPEQWNTDPDFRERHEQLERGDPEAVFAYCVGVAKEYSNRPGSDSFQPEEYAINWLKIGRAYLDQSRQQPIPVPLTQERDIAFPPHQESTLTSEQLNSTAHIASLSPVAIEAGIDSGAITNPKALLLLILNGDERTRASLKRPGETEGQFKKRFAALADGDPEDIFDHCLSVIQKYNSQSESGQSRPLAHATNWLKIGRDYLVQVQNKTFMREILDITENTDKEELVATVTRSEQYSKLSDTREALRKEIDTGKSTDPATLDKYLDASVQVYHWLARNPSERASQDAREEAGVSYLQYQKIRDGSYYKEKVGFCLEEAQGHIRITERHEKARGEAFEDENQEKAIKATEYHQESRDDARMRAANWLAIAAACMRMPHARRQAQPDETTNP